MSRLLELESYRLMVLMSLPIVHAVIPRVNNIGHEHTEIIQMLNNPHMSYAGERDLLDRICKLSARAEEMVGGRGSPSYVWGLVDAVASRAGTQGRSSLERESC